MGTAAAIIWQIVIAIILAVVSYMLTPKPKSPQSEATKQLDAPTADASRPIPVVFGSMTIKSPNCLWYGDISSQTRQVSV